MTLGITEGCPGTDEHLSSIFSSQWVCQFCTYLNYSPATMCEMCDLARPEPAPLPVKLSPPSPVRRVPALPLKPKELASDARHSCRQMQMKEDGLKLIQLIRASVLSDLSPSSERHVASVISPVFCLSGRGEKGDESRGGLHEREGNGGQEQSALQVVENGTSSAVGPDKNVGGSISEDHNGARGQYFPQGPPTSFMKEKKYSNSMRM